MNKNNKFSKIVSCETFSSALKQELLNININFKEEWIEKLYIFYSELLKWNNTHNLTRIIDFEDFLIKHLLDSLLLLKIPTDLKEKTICDVGTGAGFPGIPLAVFNPETKFYLVERIGKKCSFLHFIKTAVNLKNIEIINSDISQIEKKYHGITLRAVNVEEKFINSLFLKLENKGKLYLYLSEEQKSPNNSFFLTNYFFSIQNYKRKISVYST